MTVCINYLLPSFVKFINLSCKTAQSAELLTIGGASKLYGKPVIASPLIKMAKCMLTTYKTKMLTKASWSWEVPAQTSRLEKVKMNRVDGTEMKAKWFFV